MFADNPRVAKYARDIQSRLELWERAVHLVNERDLYPSHVCKAAGLDPSCWTHWKKNTRIPSLKALAAILGQLTDPEPKP